ncbi:ATP-binding protein [Mycoplasma sp. CSL7475-4]|uniref:Mbov_0397 family ICE element conjugal transfer ATPase n=1 Tax=Mycoplasma sp. CSL7475-4 TaxID=2973942 RepID=UPI00216AEE17|nr:ATP-binding protein [Mycoplasma sp. CSL7475-4]MCS4536795.1 ATP-binding protein [Mycoplasma sp. CSL7475-4]
MLQAKPLKKTRFNIFRNMAWYDLLLFIALVISVFLTIIFGFPFLNILYKIAIPFTFIPVIMLLFLNVKNTNYKVYQIFWVWLKFVSSKKKFKNKEINDLMVFNTIDSNAILKTHKSAKSNGLYAKLLKLNGNSIFKYDNFQQEQLLASLATNLGNISSSVNIIKINNKVEFKQNLMTINEKLKKYKDIESQKYLNAKYLDIDLLKNQNFQEYYLLVYGNSEFEMNENISNIKYAFESANFTIFEQNEIETVLFFSNFYSLGKTYDEIELKILNFSESNEIPLLDLLDFREVEFAKSHFRLNDCFFSMQAINEFDYEVENGWANTIYASDSNVIINLNKISFAIAEKLLEGANRKIGSQASETSYHLLRDKKNQYEYEIFNNLIDDIVKNQNKPLFNVSVYLLNKADNLESLKEIEKNNDNNARKEKIKLSKFHYENFKAWNQAQLPATDILNMENQALPELIAYSWPWNLEFLNDDSDLILAKSINDDSPIFFDLFHRNSNRRNNNAIIIGTSGSGKSTLSKKMLLNEYYDNAQVIIIDPQNEYKKICKQVSGQWIDLKDSGETIINPLEVQINEFGDNTVKIENILDNHIDFTGEWFKILFGDLTKTDLIIIKNALKRLYDKNNYYKVQNINELRKVAEWPIIDDLIDELELTKFDSEAERKIYEYPLVKILKEFRFFFQTQKSNRNIFNAKSNINLNNKFIVFNVKKLLAQQNQNSALAQIFLLLKIINTKISINSIDKAYFKTVLFIDEAHFALKDNTPELREFIIDTTKTIRKYNGSIILTTQNVVDISANAAKILGNIQYSLFFNCKQIDLDSIQNLYKTNQSLTEQELKFISNAKTGEALMFLTEQQHYQINIHYNDFEKDLLFDDFTAFKKHINNLKFQIESILNRVQESETKDELKSNYINEINAFENNLSTFTTYKQYLAFLVQFKENLINVI